MDTHDDFQADQAQGLETLARHIKGNLKKLSFCVVFEDELQRYWPTEKITDTELERQIQAFAESHGWNAFMHKTDFDRTRAIFLPQ
jgi:hypothetical protein